MATLFGSELSPYVRKVRIFIAEAGIDLEIRDDVVPFGDTAELSAVNPRGKIPAYKDEDVHFGESGVICQYLDRKHGGTGLYPAAAKEYGSALWFEKYAEENLTQAIGALFFNRVLTKMMDMESDEAAIERALTELQPAALAYLNEAIGDKQYLVGNQFSIADVATFSPFVNQALAGEAIDARLYPNLVRYLDALKSRPSISARIQASGAEM